MSPITINIGLNVGHSVPAGQLQRSLVALVQILDPLCIRTELRLSKSEPTLVVELSTVVGNLHALINDLAIALDQDCISYKIRDYGFLVGPRAHLWGSSFNPEFFLNPSWS